jgi:hypothetical protein
MIHVFRCLARLGEDFPRVRVKQAEATAVVRSSESDGLCTRLTTSSLIVTRWLALQSHATAAMHRTREADQLSGGKPGNPGVLCQ